VRTVFFGTPELAVPSLECVARDHEVIAVVCQPDRPKGRGKKFEAPPTKQWAAAHGIEVYQPAKLNDGTFEAWLRERAPDVCAIAAYGRLLKQPILDVPPDGFINMHPSLLPKYRGPSPIQSALLHGETVTGVTIMRLTLDMDAGDILIQETVPIAPEDDGIALTDKLARRGGELLAEGLNRIARNEAKFTPQDDSQATYCTMFTKEDGRIRWAKPARQIHNLVRAALPWPVAHCRFRNETYRIHAAVVADDVSPEAPGTVVRLDKDCIWIATGKGLIGVTVIQAPGKRAMPVSDYLRGQNIAAGERFEDL